MSEPAMRGRIPNDGGSDMGYQLFPARKSARLTVPKSQTPSFKRKMKIRATMKMEATPLARMAASAIVSLSFGRCRIRRLLDRDEIDLSDDGLPFRRQDVVEEAPRIARRLAVRINIQG